MNQFHVSSLGHPCRRYRLLQYADVPETDPATEETKALWEMGRIYEEQVIGRLRINKTLSDKAIGWPGEQMELVDNKYRVVGHPDLYDPEIGLLLEIKRTANRNEDIPNYSHIIQINQYGKMLKDMGHPVKKMTLIYGTPTRSHVQFDLEQNDCILANNETELIACNRIVDAQMALPERMPDPGSFPCSWGAGRCKYFTGCWADGMTESDKTSDKTIISDETALAMKTAEDEVASAKAILEAAEQRRDEIRETIFESPGQCIVSSPSGLAWRKTPIAGRVTYETEKMITALGISADKAEQFRKQGKGWTRWTRIKKST